MTFMKKESRETKGSFLDMSIWIRLGMREEYMDEENFFFVVKEKHGGTHWLGFKGTGTAITFEMVSEEFYLNFIKEKSQF